MGRDDHHPAQRLHARVRMDERQTARTVDVEEVMNRLWWFLRRVRTVSHSVIIGEYSAMECANIKNVVLIGPGLKAGQSGSIRIGSGSMFLEIRPGNSVELCGGAPDQVIEAVRIGMNHALELLRRTTSMEQG